MQKSHQLFLTTIKIRRYVNKQFLSSNSVEFISKCKPNLIFSSKFTHDKNRHEITDQKWEKFDVSCLLNRQNQLAAL
jgi:hypothetical protein